MEECLKPRAKSGFFAGFDYEPLKLRIGRGAYYTPDFVVYPGQPSLYNLFIYEVKGFWREAARVRIKVAAERYPNFNFVAVTYSDGCWQFETS